MTVSIAVGREPVTEDLDGPFTGCTITLKRLTSNQFAEARSAAVALIQDRGKLFILMEEHGLRPEGRRLGDLVKDIQFMAGVGEWIAAVECGVRAIKSWTGFMDGQGEDAQPLPVTREVLEAAFLNEVFLRQVMPLIDRAANLIVSEGKGSGLSLSGSPAQGRMASAPTTATAAPAAVSPAPPASPDLELGSSVRKPSTPRKPKKG